MYVEIYEEVKKSGERQLVQHARGVSEPAKVFISFISLDRNQILDDLHVEDSTESIKISTLSCGILGMCIMARWVMVMIGTRKDTGTSQSRWASIPAGAEEIRLPSIGLYVV